MPDCRCDTKHTETCTSDLAFGNITCISKFHLRTYLLKYNNNDHNYTK